MLFDNVIETRLNFMKTALVSQNHIYLTLTFDGIELFRRSESKHYLERPKLGVLCKISNAKLNSKYGSQLGTDHKKFMFSLHKHFSSDPAIVK